MIAIGLMAIFVGALIFFKPAPESLKAPSLSYWQNTRAVTGSLLAGVISKMFCASRLRVLARSSAASSRARQPSFFHNPAGGAHVTTEGGMQQTLLCEVGCWP